MEPDLAGLEDPGLVASIPGCGRLAEFVLSSAMRRHLSAEMHLHFQGMRIVFYAGCLCLVLEAAWLALHI